MKIFNKTKNCVVADDVLMALKLKEKSIGLLAYDTPRAMYFEARWGIHTFGMKFPIDVVVLDKDGKVKKIKKNMKSGNFFFWNPRWKRVLELPIRSKIKEGDVLNIIQ